MKEKARHILCLAFLKSGEKNMEKILIYQVKEKEAVFCGVNEKHFDKILFELRRKQIPVDYKAVLTPSNRKWSVLMLMLELTKEKNSFRQGN